MKRSREELNVDFIGGQGPLTKSEAEAISKYIKSQKEKRGKSGRSGHIRRSAKTFPKKVTA